MDDTACWQALEQAALAEWVRDLPLGLDTMIGDGGIHLSGGQSQRLALARALLLNPVFLILDEPTSALDYETEQQIMAMLKSLSDQIAVVLITHRPDLVANPTQIIDLGRNGSPLQKEGQERLGIVAYG